MINEWTSSFACAAHLSLPLLSMFCTRSKKREKGDVAKLLLPVVNDNELRCLRYSYHMKGGGEQMLVANFYAWDNAKMELGKRFWNTAVMGDDDNWKTKTVEISNVQAPYRVSEIR